MDAGEKEFRISVPGRVNLIGEHIDYHNLPVLPMAIQRRVCLDYRANGESVVRAESQGFGSRVIAIANPLIPGDEGDWSNYLKAAIEAVKKRWQVAQGLDATVSSDLPAAAGLSSSSALLTAFTMALLRANGIAASIEELMAILPNGEQFVGTRGGGMDHAAILGARAGCALLIEFAPLALQDVPIPDTWSFLIAHSMCSAEKSGAVREQYNARRNAGVRALAKLGFDSYRTALEDRLLEPERLGVLDDSERRTFRHVVGEALRVRLAVAALTREDAAEFGRLLCASHASLRDDLRVSSPALDQLVDAAMRAGAAGARLTGAGFGGCAIIFSARAERERIAETLQREFYSRQPAFDPAQHLIFAEASNGALIA